ncbi:uncharacterized protein SOCEGT47_000790 [Sorangium cellulosum]|uniref:Uncharacterized protein n=1 Tax=Sorangium cellulosum TaxID=56 RepID=A0A4P2PSS6_SORCE|nr:uncharacterized protein SOCEGT47_000790 [Sorangium cellulosum]
MGLARRWRPEPTQVEERPRLRSVPSLAGRAVEGRREGPGARRSWARSSPGPGVRSPEIEALARAIPVYPEHERACEMLGFVGQLEAMRWYVESGEQHGNRYLMTWAASRAVLFGHRWILVHNRISRLGQTRAAADAVHGGLRAQQAPCAASPRRRMTSLSSVAVAMRP